RWNLSFINVVICECGVVWVVFQENSLIEFLFTRYSVALVFWEIYNRLVVNDQVNEYMMTYEEYIEGDHTIEEMRHLVVEQKQRPTFAAHLDGDDLPVVRC